MDNKVVLRSLQLSDAKVSLGWRNDPAIRENVLGYRLPVTELTEKDWIEKNMNDQSKKRIILAVEQNSFLIGFVYLYDIDWINRTCYMGILIGNKDNHGKGFGSIAISQMIEYAFNILNIRKLLVEIVHYNKISMRLFKKFNFETEGVLKRQIYLNNSYHDLFILALEYSQVV